MSEQLSLVFVAATEPQAIPHRPGWETFRRERREWNNYHVRHGGVAYHPRQAQAIIMATVVADRWTGFFELLKATRMHSWLVGRLLDKLVEWGRLEQRELYYVPMTWQDGLPLFGDRLERPPLKEYRGFEWGYRLAQPKPAQQAGGA